MTKTDFSIYSQAGDQANVGNTSEKAIRRVTEELKHGIELINQMPVTAQSRRFEVTAIYIGSFWNLVTVIAISGEQKPADLEEVEKKLKNLADQLGKDGRSCWEWFTNQAREDIEDANISHNFQYHT